MPAVTVLRGFQVSVSTLDAFLVANGVSATDGIPPNYPDHPDNDHISKLLFSKMGETGDKNNYRVIIPQRTSKSDADTAYVTYCWFMVFAQRELRDGDLPTEAPQAFEGLRNEILSFANPPTDQVDGRMGLYIVFTEENNYMPDEIRQRNLIRDIRCDFCDESWTDEPYAWKRWQAHRIQVHGVNERPDPLPQA
ncbi:hypothetical protein INS49_014010 [Diaporthe citri]|uniref:uncharacterized protein n=1 Tax=Diaporthe citri TaxID=83186 RepID=UPI001C7F9BE5|nr:uncharacterized protein INS49_014010 [Diaporthe citri]KAG6358126.1 hypothetical protein INS49_014010 [Diaporthe citri]